MLIVKPYGRTRTADDGRGRRTRSLHRHLDPDRALDIAKFGIEHDELVIAQWISMIDKVLTKPRNGRKPNDLQQWARAELGAAAFAIIEGEGLLPGLSTRRAVLLQLWEKKLHPYGPAVVPARDLDRARREVKGRWYTRFAGDFDPTRLDGPRVAERLYRDLYLHESRIEPTAPNKRAGRISARAASISSNVAGPTDSSMWNEGEWSEHDWQRYSQVDVAAEIRRAVASAVQARRIVGIRLPAAILHSHYARLFTDADRKPQKLAAARQSEPDLVLLHLEVRAAYRTLLEGRKTDPVRNLPANSSQLRSLILQRIRNRRLAALVRLGKVLHYQASSTLDEDQTSQILTGWPQEVERSRFWTSDGQTEIKRNEAFVRIWRGAISIAARTVSDWADPSALIEDDLLLANNIQAVTQGRFDDTAFFRKVALLFGNQSSLFLSTNSQDRQDLLQFALQGLASIRNGAFHFKGRGGFAATLSKPHPEPRGATARSVQDLWQRDRLGRAGRLKQLLRTLHCETILDQERLARLYETLSSGAVDHTPLPRFRRVLLRVQNAWRREPWRLDLPDLPNRADLQDPERLHQYGTLKLLYERSFPTWLADRDWSWLNRLVDRAIDRASAAAKFINRDQSASARASGKLRLSPGETIDTLLDRLAAETATEFRIQRGYDQDADNARAQASYLDHLRCDIIAQAFQFWLEEAGFDYLLELPPEGDHSRCSNLDLIEEPSTEIHADPWVHRLYFLIHLIPVDDIAQLLHQLRKWRALEGGATGDLLIVEEAFGLYLDMHDAKFEGGSETLGTDALVNLFERHGDFESLLAGQSVDHQFVPWRGLREMLRFGNLTYMLPALERAHIRSRDVADLCWAESENDGPSPIAAAQDYRERLHAKWIAQKGLSPPERSIYAQQLDLVVWHRHLAARVRLHDHLRAHRLLIRVLARMIDFAGLWERDLYFVTLALIHQAGTTPAAVLSDTKSLQQGRIVPAIRTIRSDGIGVSIRNRLAELFGDIFTPKNRLVATRNKLAHFQPLREMPMPNLTEVVNETRALMAYDRKLSNAVSQSVIEMLARDGLELRWRMKDHRLASAELQTRQVQHLRTGGIRENVHGRSLVEMVASLFAGAARPREDVTTSNPARIESSTSPSVVRANTATRARSPAGRVNR